MKLDSQIYNDSAPTWKERAAKCPMTEFSWDTEADAALSDKIEMGEVTAEETAYMMAKYGEQW